MERGVYALQRSDVDAHRRNPTPFHTRLRKRAEARAPGGANNFGMQGLKQGCIKPLSWIKPSVAWNEFSEHLLSQDI